MELQYNSFKTTMRQLQTTKIIFIDIFRRNKFSYKEAQSNSFYFTLLLFFNLIKTNRVQRNIGHDNMEHALATNLAYIFLQHSLFIRRNERCVLLLFKSKLLQKYHLLMTALQNFDANLKRLSWHWQVIAQVRLTDSDQISKLVTD